MSTSAARASQNLPQEQVDAIKTPRLLILWALALIVTIAPCRLK